MLNVQYTFSVYHSLLTLQIRRSAVTAYFYISIIMCSQITFLLQEKSSLAESIANKESQVSSPE